MYIGKWEYRMRPRALPLVASVSLFLTSDARAEPMPGLWIIGLAYSAVAFLILAMVITAIYNLVIWWRNRKS